MAHKLSEESLELNMIEKLEALGFNSFDSTNEVFGENSTFGRETTSEVVLVKNLKSALEKINPSIPEEGIVNAIYQITEDKTILGNVGANKEIYLLLKNGIKVTYKDANGIDIEDVIKVIDWNEFKDNDFLVIRQFKISGDMYNCRADLIIFINGLPLVFIELKASHKHLENAFFDNIRHYKEQIPKVFWYNAFLIVSNGSKSKLGTITSQWEHFCDWKKINSEGEQGSISIETVIKGVLDKEKLLDLIENFILFQEVEGGTIKIMAKNHQFLGTNNAVESVRNKNIKEGKLGVFWHTQGSGKSFSMVFFTQKVLRKLQGNWTFLIVTDRDDLDKQIYKNFVSTGAVTELEVKAESRNHLKQLLQEDHRNIFTMIQKFGTEKQGEAFEKLSDRDNIIVITDEAHRTQYGTLAMNMRNALPNASFIAFTGTPLMSGDEKTKEVFGEYVSKYTFKQSIEDKATVPLYHESRIPELQIINDNLNKDIQKIIDEAELDEEQQEIFSSEYANMYQVIIRPDRLQKIAEDVVKHFMNRGFMGKAMYVAVDKATAVKMYDYVKIEWAKYIAKLEKDLLTCSEEYKDVIADKIKYMKETDMAVVVSPSQNEIEEIKKKGANIIPHRERIKKEALDVKFKDAKDPLRIVFVCAMWVTGFDCPTISTLYLDKILKDHTLMQTIARANRISKDKECGLIVDYIGIFKALQKALALYGSPTGETTGGEDEDPAEIKAQLIKLLDETAIEMDGYFRKHNIDVEEIFNAEAFKSIEILDKAVANILDNEKTKEDFCELANKFKKNFKAILPDVIAQKYAKQVLVTSVLLAKLKAVLLEFVDKTEIKELAKKVEELLNQSIVLSKYEIKDGKLFDLSQIDFEELRARIIKEKQKTLLETLKSSISKKIDAMMELNKFRHDFRKKFEELLTEYNSGEMTLEQFYMQLMKLSRSLTEEEKRHMQENLTEEELIVFDILTKPEPKLSKKEQEIVRQTAKELIDVLNRERLVYDWKKKQSTRAKVKLEIEQICDKNLPSIYDVDLFQKKCDNLYEHFYDNYNNAQDNTYHNVA